MRLLALIGLVLLAGCGVGMRYPVTDSQKAEWQESAERINRVKDRIVAANADICPRHCSPALRVEMGRGAYADKDVILVRSGSVKNLRNDNEVAVLFGHELAHVFLGHSNWVGRADSGNEEIEADCVGTVLAVRAGYDGVKGAKWTDDLRNSGSSAFIGKYMNPWARQQAMIKAANAVNGRPIDRDTIKAICGVSP